MQELHRLWGRNIEQWMRAWGFGSHEQLANELGVSRQTVDRWCAGFCGPSDRHKLAIARLFHCEVASLFPMMVTA